MKKLFLIMLFAMFSIPAFGQKTWTVDSMHSSINFTIKHMGISFVQGRFNKFSGSITEGKNGAIGSTMEFSVDAASINTDVDARDKHLRSADFFDVEKYPKITFKSTSVKPISGNKFEISGLLTMKDVTKPVTFTGIFGGETKPDDKGVRKMGVQATMTLNRLDYHINFDPNGTGVAKDVDITVYMELKDK